MQLISWRREIFHAICLKRYIYFFFFITYIIFFLVNIICVCAYNYLDNLFRARVEHLRALSENTVGDEMILKYPARLSRMEYNRRLCHRTKDNRADFRAPQKKCKLTTSAIKLHSSRCCKYNLRRQECRETISIHNFFRSIDINSILFSYYSLFLYRLIFLRILQLLELELRNLIQDWYVALSTHGDDLASPKRFSRIYTHKL